MSCLGKRRDITSTHQRTLAMCLLLFISIVDNRVLHAQIDQLDTSDLKLVNVKPPMRTVFINYGPWLNRHGLHH
jgi:hypothetical protein